MAVQCNVYFAERKGCKAYIFCIKSLKLPPLSKWGEALKLNFIPSCLFSVYFLKYVVLLIVFHSEVNKNTVSNHSNLSCPRKRTGKV